MDLWKRLEGSREVGGHCAIPLKKKKEITHISRWRNQGCEGSRIWEFQGQRRGDKKEQT